MEEQPREDSGRKQAATISRVCTACRIRMRASATPPTRVCVPFLTHTEPRRLWAHLAGWCPLLAPLSVPEVATRPPSLH